MATDQQLIDLIKPIIEAAHAIDNRVNCVCVNVDLESDKPFLGIYGNFQNGIPPTGCYGVEGALAGVKPYDPKAEKLLMIERLKSELAALETANVESANENA